MGLSGVVLYKVCLIAITLGSRAACSKKLTTVSKVSYGCCKRRSFCFIAEKMSPLKSSILSGLLGTNVLHFRLLFAEIINSSKSDNPIISLTCITCALSNPISFDISFNKGSALLFVTFIRITSPRFRRFNAISNSRTRSSASSSTSKSLSLRIRKEKYSSRR